MAISVFPWPKQAHYITYAFQPDTHWYCVVLFIVLLRGSTGAAFCFRTRGEKEREEESGASKASAARSRKDDKYAFGNF